jgi:hypothetical protein
MLVLDVHCQWTAAEVERAKDVIESMRPVNVTLHSAELAGAAER